MMYLFLAIIFQELRHEFLSVLCMSLCILKLLFCIFEDYNKKR